MSIEYNRHKMQQALRNGLLNYACQQLIPSTDDRTTEEQRELYKRQPIVHKQVNVLLEGVMSIIDSNLELLPQEEVDLPRPSSPTPDRGEHPMQDVDGE